MKVFSSENDLLTAIQIVSSTSAPAVLDYLVELAALYIGDGQTQEGADVLAYLLYHSDTPELVKESAQALWDDLARWICPRVLYDAEDFGRKASLRDVIDYVLL